MVTVYVLESIQTQKHYVGITNDLPRRVREHQSAHTKGGRLLGRFTVQYTEIHPDYATARKREVFLKSGAGRQWLKDQRHTGPAVGG